MCLGLDITKRKRMEDALRESETKYRRLHESMRDAFVSVGMNGRILESNQAYRALLGYSEEELRQLTYLDLTPEQWHTPEAKIVQEQVLPRGYSEVYEKEYRRKDGTVFPVELRTILIRNEAGQPEGMWAIIRDITERKRAENSLRDAERFLHSSLDAMWSHIAILDEDGRIVSVNEAWRAFARFNGIDPRRVCEGANYLQTCDQAIGEDAEEARSVAEGIRAVLGGERETYSSEYPCHSPDEQRWFSMRVTRFLGDGQPRVVVVHETITERKQAEDSLRQSEREFRGIIENVQDAYFRADTTGRLVMASPSAAHMFGFGSAKEMIGMETAALYRYPKERQGIVEELQQRGTIEDRILEGRRKEGSTFWVSLNARTYHDEPGRLLGTESFARDVTERKRAEANYRLMAETLRLWNRGDDLHSLVRETVRIVKILTDFDAVGLRLREGEDFPYCEQSGFSDAFALEENCLCAKDGEGHVARDATGQPILECTCGLVLAGRTDPDNPLFTEGGSFWTNAGSQLLGLSPDVDPRINPRNRCIHSGYESVALIPLRSGDAIVGLLQLNAHRPGQFTLERVRFFEGLATAIGIALKRKQAEEAVQRSEMQLRAVTDSVPDAIFLKDRDSRMQFTNPATLAAIGKPREAVIGKTDAEFCDDPAVGFAMMSHDRLIMELGQTQSFEETLPTPLGPRIFVTTKSPFRDGQGRVVGVVGVSRDITDHKREEDALRQREAELAQLSRVHVVGEMAAALAHELNQPLYAINNYVGGIESRLRQIDALPGSDEIITAIGAFRKK